MGMLGKERIELSWLLNSLSALPATYLLRRIPNFAGYRIQRFSL
jgi:hypothetical protein